ncbi:thioredoxin domain-containing protein [uncultured Hyphomonas sp.]|uniref:thioredoxin domain-containing protein n=1 Tax=uncultured Hyphomonas sp. TaxID=225298 RepID=UPI002AAB4D35|nr:thioredoxin domain-containing protein [uncultured Hyphomonas sp.]
MTGLPRRLAIAALACVAFAAPALAQEDWKEWDAADELGWVEGEADAPVTVIEYFSPTCSHCKEFADDVLPVVEENYIATGKVRFVTREWVRNSVDKTILTQARCLPKADGLAYLKDIFAKQDEIFVAAQVGTLPGTLMIVGTPYGITDREKFDACYQDMDIRFDMLEVDKSSEHYDVHASPTFIVDGTAYAATPTMMTPEGFTAFLDAELAKAAPATN